MVSTNDQNPQTRIPAMIHPASGNIYNEPQQNAIRSQPPWSFAQVTSSPSYFPSPAPSLFSSPSPPFSVSSVQASTALISSPASPFSSGYQTGRYIRRLAAEATKTSNFDSSFSFSSSSSSSSSFVHPSSSLIYSGTNPPIPRCSDPVITPGFSLADSIHCNTPNAISGCVKVITSQPNNKHYSDQFGQGVNSAANNTSEYDDIHQRRYNSMPKSGRSAACPLTMEVENSGSSKISYFSEHLKPSLSTRLNSQQGLETDPCVGIGSINSSGLFVSPSAKAVHSTSPFSACVALENSFHADRGHATSLTRSLDFLPVSG
ncbi:unnamed protein product [Protopolystoma xenopodis]|uniref:Uncharacterized protein n=1 Tax=Protopolystoma xenopodis TaxID=117903 RepID=A0A3S5CBV1_9PLAT|nr:unnamed protein product [Protopolystoma xenopodis]